MKISAAFLNLDVVALGDAVDTKMEFGAAGQGAGDLLAKKEVGRSRRNSAASMESWSVTVTTDMRGLATVVDGFGVVIGLAAKVRTNAVLHIPEALVWT